MSKLIILIILVISTINIFAETPTYTETENTGLNKKERIDSVEKYLIDLSSSIKKLESKLNANSEKLKSLENVVAAFKTQENKDSLKKIGEVIEPKKNNPELSKLRDELESLKSKDIEKLKSDVSSLSDTIKAIQSTIKSKE